MKFLLKPLLLPERLSLGLAGRACQSSTRFPLDLPRDGCISGDRDLGDLDLTFIGDLDLWIGDLDRSLCVGDAPLPALADFKVVDLSGPELDLLSLSNSALSTLNKKQ